MKVYDYDSENNCGRNNKFNIKIKPIKVSELERKKRREKILEAILEENNGKDTSPIQ